MNADRRLAGAVIAEARKASGMTQAELAARVGRKQAWLSCLENGDRRCTLETFVMLARAMGKRPAALCTYYEHLMDSHIPVESWFRAPAP